MSRNPAKVKRYLLTVPDAGTVREFVLSSDYEAMRTQVLGALREAEAGLLAAGAATAKRECDFLASPSAALRDVRAAISKLRLA